MVALLDVGFERVLIELKIFAFSERCSGSTTIVKKLVVDQK